MKEIKFRVWSEDQKTYDYKFPYNSIGDFYVNTRGKVFSDFGNTVAPEVRQDAFVVEQYTGLKDKNGKEMYEGDIVALLFGYVPMKSVTTENIRIENAQKAVIHFDTLRGAFRYTIKLRTPKDCQFKPNTNTNMIVIGNIHENPELLWGEDGE